MRARVARAGSGAPGGRGSRGKPFWAGPAGLRNGGPQPGQAWPCGQGRASLAGSGESSDGSKGRRHQSDFCSTPQPPPPGHANCPAPPWGQMAVPHSSGFSSLPESHQGTHRHGPPALARLPPLPPGHPVSKRRWEPVGRGLCTPGWPQGAPTGA